MAENGIEEKNEICKTSPSAANKDSLSLKCILEAFNAPVNEEQAWAVCYQAIKCLTGAEGITTCTLENVIVEKDGLVRLKSNNFLSVSSSERTSAETRLIRSIGSVVYGALDYGVNDSEERNLSESLEDLIECLTTGTDDDDSQTGDEGFENDVSNITPAEVMQMCANHLQRQEDAPDHYRAVCRALVTEAADLLTFLEKISANKEYVDNSTDDDFDELRNLGRIEWARLWVQVLQSLRQGVKLKKVEHVDLPPLEFELTPYEILMEDIRMRRYTLNKIMVDGEVPVSVSMKNDAHSVILEFIRSRPPLQPVSQRKLRPPPPRVPILHEQLLEEIKGEHKLRKTFTRTVETSRTKLFETDATPTPTRKIIKPDFSLLLTSFEDESSDDDVDDLDDIDAGLITPSSGDLLSSVDVSSQVQKKSTWRQTVAFDVLVGNTRNGNKVLERRHSITVCESPVKSSSKVEDGETFDPIMPAARDCLPVTHVKSLSDLIGHDLAQVNFGTRGDNPNPVNFDTRVHDPTCVNTNRRVSKPSPKCSQFNLSHLTREQLHKRWQYPVECLSLTVDEVMHIRSVLTKAELESLLVNPSLYALVSRGKVCFTCKRTKFTLFGPWGTKCKFCRRKVCQSCIKKMRIPTDHFESIPVYTLSPGPLSPNSTHAIRAKESTGSVPSSPLPERKSKRKLSEPCMADDSLEKSAKVELEGPLMDICRDCKILVLNVIRASRTSIALAHETSDNVMPVSANCREKSRRNFHLDLNRVY